MKKTTLLPLMLLFLILGMISCIDDDSQKPDNNDLTRLQEITITNNTTVLNTRLQVRDEIVIMIPDYYSNTKSDELPPYDYTKNFSFKLRADVNPPLSLGDTLMATHVDIEGNYAFVSYNIRGSKYGGAVEVFDVTNLTQPLIISQAFFPFADINTVDYDNGKVYIAGAFEQYEGLGFEGPSFMQILAINDQMQITGVEMMMPVPSFSANGIAVSDDKIYVTSGDNGGVSIFDRETKELLSYIETADARSVAVNINNAYVFSGMPGKIDVYNNMDNSFVQQIATGGAGIPHSKSQITANEDYIFAAIGDDGARMYTINGDFKQHFPKPETPAGEPEENFVTNSVSLNYSLLFMANGEAGIEVGEIVPQDNDSVVVLGRMMFEDMESSNYVASKDSVIFVASGLGGLKILSISIDEGIPDDIIPTEPCPTLMASITASLPEQQNAMQHSPWLFSPDNTRNIITSEATEVYITFIFEGAGWKNTFGYYAYPANDPPTSIAELEKHVVFPNVSMVNEGGGLEPGDMVQLGDSPFAANTVIGFYLVAKGWANGQMVDGVYTHYTNTEWNPNNTQQHILFIESGCQDLVFGFEDVKIPSGDKDFNDIILAVKDNPEDLPNTKFNTEGIVNLNFNEE